MNQNDECNDKQNNNGWQKLMQTLMVLRCTFPLRSAASRRVELPHSSTPQAPRVDTCWLDSITAVTMQLAAVNASAS